MVKWHVLKAALRALVSKPFTVRSFTREGEHVDPGLRFKGMMVYDKDSCSGCMLCSKTCPAGAVNSEPGRKVSIDLGRCIFCGQCIDVCTKGSISFTPGNVMPVTDPGKLVLK